MKVAWEIEELKEEHFSPKWYLNGFPKSGLHLVSLMVMPLAKPMFDSHEIWNMPWAGPFAMNSWTNYEAPLARVTYKIGRLRDGLYMKGHCGYSDDMERFLWHLGVANIFIYRDLRDVAVSQAFHVLSDNDDLMSHPDKDLYKAMDSFEDVLMAVIQGVSNDNGIEYPGVIDRWERYAGWLDVDWVLKFSYEEVLADRMEAARRMIFHGLDRVSVLFGVKPEVIDPNIEKMAEIMVLSGQCTEQSPTFRKGRTGDWREHFTPRITEEFKARCGDWLIDLGYEEGYDW